MRVYVESVLECSADAVWDEVCRVELLREIASPLMRFAPLAGESLPAQWTEGATTGLRTYLFSFIPLGTHWIMVDRIDRDQHEIQTRERSLLVRRWDHRIHVEPVGAARTLYADEIIIEAGVLTLPVYLFAQWFYRHRQRRWRRVAERLRTLAGKSRTA